MKMEDGEQVEEENLCVSREEFELEMRKIFGDPIGSSTASKVLSDDRCDACFEYLMMLEEKEQAYSEYKASNERLKEVGFKRGGEMENVTSAGKLVQSMDGVSEEVKNDILLRAAAYSAYTTVMDKLKQNDDKKDERGVKIHGRWGRYIKDAVGRGKSRRLFMQKLPGPEGVTPKYTLVASKGGLGATMLDVVKPSRWYEVLLRVHAQKNHAGRDKIFSAVKEQYWNVPKFAIDRFSKLCQARQQKALLPPVPLLPKVEKPVMSEGFLNRVQLFIFPIQDVLPQSSFQYVCCIKDVATQFVQLWVMERIAAEESAGYLLSFMLRFGGVHILHLENGPDFESQLMNTLANTWDYPIVVGSSLAHLGNHAVDLIRDFLSRWYPDKSKTESTKVMWQLQLEKIAYAINCTVNKSKGKTPHECVFGQKPKMGSVFPGLSHSVVRETFKRSYVLEEELDPERRKQSAAPRGNIPSELEDSERAPKVARKESPGQDKYDRKRLALSIGRIPRISSGNSARDFVLRAPKQSRDLHLSTRSAVEELAEKRSSRGESSKSDDMMDSIMKA